MRTASFALFVMLLAAPAAVSHASEHVLVTSGVVTAVDTANGIVVLDSGVKLRVRNVIVGDQVADIAAIRAQDTVFVSGIVLGGDAEAHARTRAGR